MSAFKSKVEVLLKVIMAATCGRESRRLTSSLIVLTVYPISRIGAAGFYNPPYLVMAGLMGNSDSYSPSVGMIFVFNLIVGTGALTLPAAFLRSGWFLGICLLVFLAFVRSVFIQLCSLVQVSHFSENFSYITATLVIESMAAVNAIIKWESIQKRKKCTRLFMQKGDDVSQGRAENMQSSEIEWEPLLTDQDPGIDHESAYSTENLFEIRQQVEMGKMARLFFNRGNFAYFSRFRFLLFAGSSLLVGLLLFYLTIAIYLYGDLAIYCAAVAKSLRDISWQVILIFLDFIMITVITYVPANQTCNGTAPDTEFCWGPNFDVTRKDVYRIFIGVFISIVGPFTFFNVQKTKMLQVFTSVLRWLAFTTMIVLAAMVLIKNGPTKIERKFADPMGLSNFIGICVYSFMCHHSLPSMITPISNKNRLGSYLAVDYVLILGFYSLLALSGIFAFDSVPDLYTLEFQPNRCNPDQSVTNVAFFQYFLALFPVFTLSTNFPIISITLRENLKSLWAGGGRRREYTFVNRVVYPLIALVPPVLVALVVSDLEFLVGVTGSYAGVGIQYVIPCALVWRARQLTKPGGKFCFPPSRDDDRWSVFRSSFWIIMVIIWAATCIIFVTINHFKVGM
ncbi:unnamed protein product [Notodromas monacha]|uniref:Amino acid transporter transmembrane domain-containing protein n=1 Tax=Notodromas monacha TaxID=399045 RepID=A0A7R9BJ12_9CRUS|nr:unnamed protein product [Notodromas monacha]CAG0915602.1 unnamed protein product [Notodromas monacha]